MRNLITTLCVMLAATALAGTSAMADASAGVPKEVISKNTIVKLQLSTDLHSGRQKVGDRVAFTVMQNVDGPNGSLLVARGAPAAGHVTVSFPHGDFGKRGRITFTCDSVRAADGTQIPLHLTVTAPAESDTAADDVFSQNYDSFGDTTFGTDSFSPPIPDSQDGYVQSALPGGYYYAPSSWGGRLIYNPGRFFGGEDAVVKHGQKYSAKVSADTPLNAASY